MNRFCRYLAPFVIAAMLGACGIKQSIEDADKEVGEFHQLLDAGKLERIWTTADPDMRKAGSKTDFETFLAAVSRKLGKVKESERIGWNANTNTNGTFVTVTMQTTFERGSGTETLVYRKGENDRLALVGYNIDSREMMLN